MPVTSRPVSGSLKTATLMMTATTGSSEPMTAVGVEPMSLMALTSVMSEMTVETSANSRMLMPVSNVMAGVNESRERARSRKKAAQNSME